MKMLRKKSTPYQVEDATRLVSSVEVHNDSPAFDIEDAPLVEDDRNDELWEDEHGSSFHDSLIDKKGRRTRISCCRRFCYVVTAVTVYYVMVYFYLSELASSHPTGYIREEQRLTLFGLTLFPLIPWVKKQNLLAIPTNVHAVEEQGIDQSAVQPMPSLIHQDETAPPASVDLNLASGLSGCTPKFILSASNAKFLFKPSRHVHQVWMELLAYHVNQLGGFHRVPHVYPFQVAADQLKKSVSGLSQATHSFLSCSLDLASMDEWIQNDPDTPQAAFIGTLQIMVPAVTKRSKAVNSIRYRIGRWTDHNVTAFAQREINTRTLLDYMLGNYDRYNNDFVQVQPNGDRTLVYIDQGSYGNWTIPPGAFETGTGNYFKITDYCRFYWQVVERLRELHQGSLRQRVVEAMQNDEISASWIQKGLIDIDQHPTMIDIDGRLANVIALVDQCIDQYGHDYVFVQTSDH